MWMPHWAGLNGNGIPFFNIGLFDFGPAMFYFIIGLSLVPAYQKSVRRVGKKGACVKLFYRNCTIIGIAAIGVFFTNLYLWRSDWSHFASIGVTGILLIPFLHLDTKQRLAAAVAILITYQTFRVQLFELLGGSEYAGHGISSFGGIAACVGFSGAALLTTVLSDLRRKSLWRYAGGATVLALSAVIAARIIGIRYEQYNLPYLLAALAAFSAVFGALCLINKLFKDKPAPVLSAIGRSMLYFLLLSLLLGALCDALFTPTRINLVISLLISYSVFLAAAFLCEKYQSVFKM